MEMEVKRELAYIDTNNNMTIVRPIIDKYKEEYIVENIDGKFVVKIKVDDKSYLVTESTKLIYFETEEQANEKIKELKYNI